MTQDTDELVVATPRGLYCPAGDFHIDPLQPVQTAVVTHGHADHLRPGHARTIVARPGLGIARWRLGSGATLMSVDYGAPVGLGATRVSLHPAGHILGSAQVRIEHAGRVWVVSGDYKRDADPTCAAFEVLACDTFVSEATFARPEHQWPPSSEVLRDIGDWWAGNASEGRASVLYCYALGKAQRLLAGLQGRAAGAVVLHPAIAPIVEIYRAAGVPMLPTTTATNRASDAGANAAGDLFAAPGGTLYLAPPSAARKGWAPLPPQAGNAFCSGWMSTPAAARARGFERGFMLSDHADWPALVDTCLATGARQIRLMHGDGEALLQHLRQQGIDARPLAIAAR